MRKLSCYDINLGLKRKKDLLWIDRIDEVGLLNNKGVTEVYRRLLKHFRHDFYYFRFNNDVLVKRRVSKQFLAHLLRRYREGILNNGT